MPDISQEIEYINGSEFARRVGVVRQAVSAGIKSKIIIKEKGKGINPLHPINIKYVEALNTRKGRNESLSLSKAVETEYAKKLEEILFTLKNNQNQPADAQKTGELKESQQPNNLKDYNPKAVAAYSESKNQQNELTRAKASKAQIELAKMMGVLVLKADVERFWGRVIGSLHTYVLPLSDRLSDDTAAICGVTDPKIILEVRQAIDKEVVTALTQVKNTAEDFSAKMTNSS